MLRSTVSAVTALALIAAPVAVQAASQPVARAGSSLEESGEQLTSTHWVLIVLGGILLVWGIIELTDDDEPESP
jgi:uncharacterized membrane protein YidH (DUF202 family)